MSISLPRMLKFRWAPSIGYISWRLYANYPDCSPSKKKHPVERICTGQSGRSYPCFSKQYSRIQYKMSKIILPFLNPPPKSHASPPSLKFPSATMQPGQAKWRAASTVYICKVFGSRLPLFSAVAAMQRFWICSLVFNILSEKIYIVENNLWRASNFMRSVLLLPSLQRLTKPNMCRHKYT